MQAEMIGNTETAKIDPSVTIIYDRWLSNTVLITATIATVVYLSFIINFVLRATNPECVECGGSASPWFLEDIISVPCKVLGLSEIGDYFSGMTAFLVIFWVILAFIWQVKELGNQIEQLADTNRNDKDRLDLERRMQATSTILELADRLEKQVERLEPIRDLLGLENEFLQDRSITNLLKVFNQMEDEFEEIKTATQSAERLKIKYRETLKSGLALVKLIQSKWDKVCLSR